MHVPSLAAPSTVLLVWCVCSTTFGVASGDVRKPSAPIVVQALRPSGLRISVSDSPGTDVVIINANVNLPISDKETGQVSRSVLQATGGYWTLEAKDVTLKPGDVVFYWVYTGKGSSGDRLGGHQAIHELLEPSCGPSPTTFNGKMACAGQLIFEENFDTFNTSLWKHSIQFSDDPDIEFATYVDDPENSFVKDGALHLKATVLTEDELLKHTKLEKCTWTRGGTEYCERKPAGWNILPPIRSAMLTTDGTFSFKFGRIDIRAKTAAGDWLLSRLLLEPKTREYGRRPYESGRMEILRSRGNPDVLEPSGWQLGARLNDPQVDIATCARILYMHKNCPLNVGKLYSNEMHIFSVKWTPESLAFTVDGQCEHVVSPPVGGFLKLDYYKDSCHNSPWKRGTFMAPFDKEFYVHISLLPGGFSVYKDKVNSKGNFKPWSDWDPLAMLKFWQSRNLWFPTWTSDMEVDFVKVWAL